ncbi:hypothetical protein C9374_000238 [Naegleria lovaniensis]|uniref:F-box domain-containing protein n=1 Tax=Naegleria lovaniensis TaxID=51637 RepID=A0AA88GZE7_NAELO|nr:uncharacterized protein C9374_000238 [Naegleria lovaniensis]KAG2388799.1 hypothetical protein C9374_000238 [Naegleria lovaniensis]
MKLNKSTVQPQYTRTLKKIKKSLNDDDRKEGINHTTILELPFELLSCIMDFIKNPRDGFHFSMMFKQWYYELYATHELFIGPRILSELNKMKYDPQPRFSLEKPTPPPSTKNKRILKMLSTIASKVTQQQEQLDSIQTKHEKMDSWKKYIGKIKKKRGSQVAQLVSQQIFEKVEFQKMRVWEMDYRKNFGATITIGELTFRHEAYDERDCSTQWTLSEVIGSGTNHDDQSDITLMVAKREEEFTSYDPRVVDRIRHKLGLGCVETQNVASTSCLTDKLIVKCLLRALPWREQMNCVFVDSLAKYEDNNQVYLEQLEKKNAQK